MADNVAFMRRFIKEVQQDGHLDLLPEFIDPEVENHTHPGPPGLEGARAMLETLHSSIKDITITVEHCISSGDTIATNKVIRGTLVKAWAGVEGKGQQIELRVMDWIVLSPAGKFRHHWGNVGPVVEI